MKLWLLEILACPIDHSFPLELTIFKWYSPLKREIDKEKNNYEKINEEIEEENENNKEDSLKNDLIKDLIERYRKGNVLTAKQQSPVVINEEEQLLIKDFLVLKSVNLSKYLSQLLEKIKELEVVNDKSDWVGNEALKLIKDEIADKLQSAKIKTDNVLEDIKDEEKINKELRKIIDEIINELEFLNVFKYLFEIEEGVMRCPKCNRWFPISETIPQMLPDQFRDEQTDMKFKEKWKKKFDF